MTYSKKYYIRINNRLVEVSQDVYKAYYSSQRQEKTLLEKERRNGVFSYNELDTENSLGEEMVADKISPSVEAMVINKLLRDQLHEAWALLTEEEQTLLKALYFEDISEHELARAVGIPRMTIHNRKVKALGKLKKFLKI